MTTPTLPTQETYLSTGVVPFFPSQAGGTMSEPCSICLCDLTPSSAPVEKDECVTLTPCNHAFHKECIMQWFRGTNQKRCTCPNCRTELFVPDKLTPEQIDSMTDSELEDLDNWPIRGDASQRFSIVMSRPQQGNTQSQYYSNPYRLLERDNLAFQWFVDRVITAHELFAEQHGTTYDWKYCVNYVVVTYRRYGWPRTDVVIQESLLKLIVTAALIYQLARTPHNSTLAYAQLLAYGEQLLLDAQRDATECERRARSAAATAEDVLNLLEFKRVLDHRDDADRHPGNWSIRGGEIRMQWIVELRMRTQGRNVAPTGPGNAGPWQW